MADYSRMTHDDFDATLHDILREFHGNQLLDIPGIYAILSEHFNNDVLTRWAEEHPRLAYPEDDADENEE